MPKFLYKASYTPEGVKGVAAKGGSARPSLAADRSCGESDVR